MMKFNHRKSALALCIAAMTAVSGNALGRELLDVSAGDMVDTPYSKLLDLVEREAIGRQAYALTANLGKYGTVLQQTGWYFKWAFSTNSIPNNAKTVVYINANDQALTSEDVKAFLATFKGVIIVDSNWIVDDGLSKKLGELPPNASANEVNALIPQATLFYSQIGLNITGAPNSTAIVRSSQSRTTFSINFTEDGLVNGMKPTEFTDAIDMRITAASNMARGIELETSASNGGAKDYGIADETVEIYAQYDGWIAAGKYQFWAWKTQSGKYYVAMDVVAGDNLSNCLVQGKYKCGIYPINRGNIIWTTTIGPNEKDTISFATRYSAGISSFQTNTASLQDYRPSAAAWNATEAINSDSTWHTWSEGWSIGASFGFSSAGSFSAGASAGYSQSSSHTKRYTPWYGQADQGWTGDGARYAWSGIHLNSERDVVDTFWPGAYDTEYNFETSFRGEQFAGQTNWCGWDIKNNLKPRSSFEGWNPSVAGTFQVYPAQIFGANFVTIASHLNWSRAVHKWKRETVTWHSPTAPGSGNNMGGTGWRLYRGSTASSVCGLAATGTNVKDYSVKQSWTVWGGGTTTVNYFNTIQ